MSKRQRTPLLAWTSLLVAAIAMIVPLPSGVEIARPHFVALILIYWRIESPENAGLGTAFVAGILLDILLGGRLGVNGLGLVVVAYIVGRFRLRIRFFPLWQQAFLVFAVLLNDRLIYTWIAALAGDPMPGWGGLWGPAVGMLAWPWIFLLLDDLRLRVRRERKGRLARLLHRLVCSARVLQAAGRSDDRQLVHDGLLRPKEGLHKCGTQGSLCGAEALVAVRAPTGFNFTS